jgi:hypothetical protein
MITNDERCKRESKSLIVILKAAFNRKKFFVPANWTWKSFEM